MFIAGRCDGTSSTSAMSSVIACDSACIRYSTGIGSAAAGAGARLAACLCRALCLGQCHQQRRQRRLHGGDDAGADRGVGGGVAVVGDLEDRGAAIEDCGMAFDMEGEDGRADHDHEVVVAQGFRHLSGRCRQEAGELRMPLREGAARRERADPDRGLCFLRDIDHQIDGFRAIDGGADHKGGMLAGVERRDQRLHRIGIGTDLAAHLPRRQAAAPDASSRRSAPRRRSARKAAASRCNRRARSRRARPRAAPARRCI